MSDAPDRLPRWIARLGVTLFGPYAVATEAVGFLLLLAALALPMRRPGEPR